MSVVPFFLDYETRSELALDERGLDNYVRHKSTQVILAAYAEGDHKVKLWEPHLSPMPSELKDALTDPWVQVHAHHADFEIEITENVLGIPKPVNEWRDTMTMCRYVSLPGKLEAAGEILGLTDQAKIKDGKRLIKLFCEPELEAGLPTLFGPSEATFRDWSTDPKDWHLFGEYCKQDVIAERAIEKKLEKFKVPDHEWEMWFLHEAINRRGWPLDMETVRGARFIVEKELGPLVEQITSLSGIKNPSSPKQVLAWLETQGYGFSGLNKTFVNRALSGESNLTEAARKVLEIRAQTSKTSVNKYTVLADLVGSDGRLRHQYQFMGASRTHRWSALGANVGNLPKPTPEVEANLDRAVELVQLMDYEGIVREFGKPLDVVTSTIRPSFRAPEGFKFVIADLNAIENRGAGYISRCDSILKVFRDGKDPYLDFATHFYKLPYEQLEYEYKILKDKSKRTMCKPASLGSSFGLGPGEETTDKNGDKIWTGLLGYARNMGVVMTPEEADRAIKIFRSAYPEVKHTWKDLERACIRAIRNPGQMVGVGVPQNDRDREYMISQGRNPDLPPIISFKCTGKKFLEMVLPSGTSLHYIDPEVTEEDAVWQGKPYKRLKISYYGKEQNSTTWGRVSTFGGKLFENADQKLSRDVLCSGLKNADAIGFEIVGHTYDEAITLVRIDSHLGVKELCECLTKPTTWGGDAFPLGAAGFEDFVYRKD